MKSNLLNLSKINISFLNLAAQSPSLELNLALSEKIHNKDKNKKHVFFMCDRALNSCDLNVLNKRSICNICTYKAKKGFKLFNTRNPNSELIKITKKDLKFNERIIIDKAQDEELILGVHSSISSQLRIDNMNLLDKTWKNIKTEMYNSAKGLYLYFDKYLSFNNVENFIIFNGRLSCSRPLITVSKKNNVTFNLFDAAVNGKVPKVSVNELFHSLNFEKTLALKAYVKNFKNSRIISEKYMSNKIGGVITSDFAYTKNQVRGYIDKDVLEFKKPIISIYVSSDDEIKFLGSDWSKFGLPDQIDSVCSIINSDLKNKYDFVVKMHPNQKYVHKSIMDRYLELSKRVKILFPENKTDTYSLISYSSIILNFCSTVGAEANYMRKPVVQIGASRFRLLPVANYVNSAEDAIKIIERNKFKLMPIRASIVYFSYHGINMHNLKAYKYIQDGVFTYGDKFIKVPFVLRFLALPDKFIYHILKGNRQIISNLPMYINNLLLGRTAIKK